MSDDLSNNPDQVFTIKEEIVISDPEIISFFKSEGKLAILQALILTEMNIQDLKVNLKMNPGSIKRHLDQLLEGGIIKQTKEIENSWGVKMKYYRSLAKRFTIKYSWPDKV